MSVLAIFLSGCSSQYYMTTMQPVHLLKEKGEFSGTATVSQTEDSDLASIFEGQAAYALTDNLAITAGGTRVLHRENDGFLIDLGMGYFLPLGSRKRSVFEVYGSAAYGKVFPGDYLMYTTGNNLIYQELNPSYLRACVQPVIGGRFKHIDLAASTRFVALHASLPKPVITNASSGNDPAIQAGNQGIEEGMYYFAEPAITLRLGVKNLKLHLQSALAFQINQAKPLAYQHLNLNTGLSLRLPFEKAPKPAGF